MTKAKKFNFEALKDKLVSRQRTTDSSEHKHVIEFLIDVVDSVRYDVEHGHNYVGEEREALLAQMTNTLIEFKESCKALETFITKELKP